jgi:hypothetical protein
MLRPAQRTIQCFLKPAELVVALDQAWSCREALFQIRDVLAERVPPPFQPFQDVHAFTVAIDLCALHSIGGIWSLNIGGRVGVSQVVWAIVHTLMVSNPEVRGAVLPSTLSESAHICL